AEFATSGKLPNMVALASAYAQRMVMSKIDKITKLIPGLKGEINAVKAETSAAKAELNAEKNAVKSELAEGKKDAKKEAKKSDKKNDASPPGDGVKVVGSGGDNDCGIKPYKDQKCPKGQQAHHIVPDYALRYGNRKNTQARIPGMPSLDDGPSICLSGGSKTNGSEHNQAHEGTDPKIAAAGLRADNGPNGLATMGEILDISTDEVAKVKPHCKDEIKRKVDEAFKGVDKNKYGRTTQALPKGEARATLEDGGAHESSRDTRIRKGKKK
ncbi:hypothetical protein AAKU64_004635, partial [Undibacterium sp. GrIS 1.8]|uniref:hypothetical protein n=1 Tax=unclassified Undibacterium TaxID=2630295 RepID=UPI00339572B0